LEVDRGYFPDDDDIQAGDIDIPADWRVEQWPEGFIWQCCQAYANGKPCEVQKHVATGASELGGDDVSHVPIIDLVSSDNED
jgi:hypothetical protein